MFICVIVKFISCSIETRHIHYNDILSTIILGKLLLLFLRIARNKLCGKIKNFLVIIPLVYCKRWGRFDVLDVRLYIGPRVDLRVLQGVTVTGEN